MEQNVSLAVMGLGVVVVFLAGWVLKLQADISRMSHQSPGRAGRQVGNGLDTTGLEILDRTREHVDEVSQFCRSLDQDVRRCLQRVGFVRYNAYGDATGEQSFSLAMLDREGNGVLLNSLHGRAGTRLYGKLIQYGEAMHELSGEEESALRAALSGSGDDSDAAVSREKGRRSVRPGRR